MKTIDEQTQMQLFDLLENNLTEEEALQILKKIDNDPLLNKEYHLLKATYLNPNDSSVVFEDKASLYRSARVIPLYRKLNFRYAAAIALLLATGSILWRISSGTNTPSHLTNPVVSHSNSQPALENHNQNKINDKVGDSTNTKSFAFPKTTKKAPLPDLTNDDEIHQSPKAFNRALSDSNNVLVASAELNQLPSRRTLPNLIKDTSILQDYELVFDTPGKPATITKRRSLGYRLLNSSRYMLANLSLPDIELKKNGNKLKIEVFTYDKNPIANQEY